jgi:hypothetical protein
LCLCANELFLGGGGSGREKKRRRKVKQNESEKDGNRIIMEIKLFSRAKKEENFCFI